MLKEKIKALVTKGQEQNPKRKIESLVVFVIILIITLIIINYIWSGNNESKEKVEDNNKKLATVEESSLVSASTAESKLKQELEEILSNIEGVGKVKVLVTYSQTSQTLPMYNEDTSQKNTEEKDTSGGSRKVIETDTQKEVIYEENNGSKTPITQSIVSPKIEGAVITAQGAGSASVKANIIQAVEAVTGLSSHKIQVFTMANEN